MNVHVQPRRHLLELCTTISAIPQAPVVIPITLSDLTEKLRSLPDLTTWPKIAEAVGAIKNSIDAGDFVNLAQAGRQLEEVASTVI